MTTYNTGNPVPSTEVKDLFDNCQTEDEFCNGDENTTVTRTGKTIKTMEGMNNDFNQFLIESGFEPNHLTYVDGTPLQVDRPTQLIDRAGSVYRVKMPASFPVTLTGTWGTDAALLVDVGDQSLRTQLANTVSPTQGAALAGRAIRHINSATELRALAGTYDGETVYLREHTLGSGVGSGYFVWSSASVAADDNGVQISKWRRASVLNYVDAEWFGLKNDGSDAATAFENAITFAGTAVSGSQGMIVRLPVGTVGISREIMLPNRVAVVGANGRGTTIKPLAGFTGTHMFTAANGTSSMFGSRLEDLHLDARGFNLSAVVYSVAWQETCGMNRVLIQYDGATPYGFLYETGNGGAAILKFKDVEIFSNSSAATRDAVRINQVSLVGGFLFLIENSTFAGSAANPLTRGINMVNDSLVADGLHIEYCSIGILSQGAGNLDVRSMTGSGNQVVDMVALGSGFTGRAHLQAILPNGATGNIVTNSITGNHVEASGQRVASFVYPLAAFNAHVSAQIPDVTGNGTEYTVLFNTERFDLSNNFAAGTFTAAESGKYQLSCAVKLTVPNTATTCVVKISTTSKEYYVFRGSLANLRDASGTVTLSGSVLADMARGATARVRVTVSGIGTDTADVEATETWFTGFKACW